MQKEFGRLPDGSTAYLYTIRSGKLEAHISDLGATIQRLYVPDANGALSDVVLGFDNPTDYIKSGTFFGTVVGRNCNRTGTSRSKENKRSAKPCYNLNSPYKRYNDC